MRATSGPVTTDWVMVVTETPSPVVGTRGVHVAPDVTGSALSRVSVHEAALFPLNEDQKGSTRRGSGLGRENRAEGGRP